LAEARRLLNEAGLALGNEEDLPPRGDVYKVYTQNPDPGTSVACGSRVVVSVD
jgi:beta-lactam-binding protein with PASTA domain